MWNVLDQVKKKKLAEEMVARVKLVKHRDSGEKA